MDGDGDGEGQEERAKNHKKFLKVVDASRNMGNGGDLGWQEKHI